MDDCCKGRFGFGLGAGAGRGGDLFLPGYGWVQTGREARSRMAWWMRSSMSCCEEIYGYASRPRLLRSHHHHKTPKAKETGPLRCFRLWGRLAGTGVDTGSGGPRNGPGGLCALFIGRYSIATVYKASGPHAPGRRPGCLGPKSAHACQHDFSHAAMLCVSTAIKTW